LVDPDEIEDFSNEVISALSNVFDTIDDIKQRISDTVSVELHGQATSAFINQTIETLGEVSTHYETGAVWIDDVKVLSLDADRIKYRIKGNVAVTLLYGSGSDRANDTGAEIAESFPYDCQTLASASDPTKFDAEQTTMEVDTTVGTETRRGRAKRQGKRAITAFAMKKLNETNLTVGNIILTLDRT
jgi:hypothetical protein